MSMFLLFCDIFNLPNAKCLECLRVGQRNRCFGRYKKKRKRLEDRNVFHLSLAAISFFFVLQFEEILRRFMDILCWEAYIENEKHRFGCNKPLFSLEISFCNVHLFHWLKIVWLLYSELRIYMETDYAAYSLSRSAYKSLISWNRRYLNGF